MLIGIPEDAENREVNSDSYDLSKGILGVILYNPTDRDGAEEEANILESSLRSHASHVIREAWSTQCELALSISKSLNSDISGYSALLVCISAHGTAGNLCGKDGSVVAINDILFQFTRRLPAEMPLVGN